MLHVSASPMNRSTTLAWTLFASLIVTGACGGAASQTEKSEVSLSSEPASQSSQFDLAFAKNLKAAESHFWEIVDCEKRDEVNGMPTTRVPLPGATRTFLEPAEYTLYYFFPKEGLGQSDLHAFVRARMPANIPEGYSYTYESSPDSGDCTLSHEGSPDDFPSVELSEASGLLQILFFPAQNAEIPWGDPCAPRER